MPPLKFQDLSKKIGHVALIRQIYKSNLHTGVPDGSFIDDMNNVISECKYCEAYNIKSVMQNWQVLQGVDSILTGLFRAVLEDAKDAEVIPLLVYQQNALLLIEKHHATFLIHACEILPSNSQAFQGNIAWPVPQVTFKVPRERLLSKQVIKFLETFCDTEYADCMHQSKKAGTQNTESREPPFPARLFEWLLPVISDEIEETAKYCLIKKMRHQVSYGGGKDPWVRSMEWHAVKAVCHWVLERNTDGHIYKCLILEYLSKLLIDGYKSVLNNDIVYELKAKIASRVNKLMANNHFNSSIVKQVCRNCLECVETVTRWQDARWTAINQNMHSDYRTLNHDYLDLNDAKHDCKDIISFCQELPKTYKSNAWKPVCESKPVTSQDFLAQFKSKISSVQQECMLLIDFENWVFSTAFQMDQSAIYQFAKLYYNKATQVYQGDPVGYSRSIICFYLLTVMYDREIISQYPILVQHKFSLQIEVLSSVLAPSARLMHLVHEIEEYVDARNTNAIFPSLISGDLSQNSFGYRYADENCSGILEVIESKNQVRVKQKRAEVENKVAEYNELIQYIHSSECSYQTDKFGGMTHVKNRCHNCSMKRRAYSMTAAVYEESLPKSLTLKKIVVFELRAPDELRIYRDHLHFVEQVITKYSAGSKDVYVQWSSKPDLTQYYCGNIKNTEYQLLSTVKSFTNSHYKSQKITKHRNPETYIKPSGCNVLYGVSISNKMGSAKNILDEISELCLLKCTNLNLQEYVKSTTHQDSLSIGNQEDCPESIQIPCLKAFGNLRAGVNIQFYNICRAIVSRDLTFGDPDTYVLICQAIWQTETKGPNHLRLAYQELNNQNFMLSFLGQIQLFLEDNKNRWEQPEILRVVIALAARFFVLAEKKIIKSTALELLLSARNVGMSWFETVLEKHEEAIQNNHGHAIMEKQKHMICDVALVVCSSYHVDENLIYKAVKSSDDICSWLRLINAVSSTISTTISNETRQAYKCAIHLANSYFGKICNSIKFRNGCSKAIKRIWRACSDGVLSDHWQLQGRSLLVTDFYYSGNSTKISINLITGEFTVNGMTVGTLPASITSNTDFVWIFGPKINSVRMLYVKLKLLTNFT